MAEKAKVYCWQMNFKLYSYINFCGVEWIARGSMGKESNNEWLSGHESKALIPRDFWDGHIGTQCAVK